MINPVQVFLKILMLIYVNFKIIMPSDFYVLKLNDIIKKYIFKFVCT